MNTHIKVISVTYRWPNEGTTVCIIKWRNPITGNIQRSKGIAHRDLLKDAPNSVLGMRLAESRAKVTMWEDYIYSTCVAMSRVIDRHEKLRLNELARIKALCSDD